jgi:uncharacterized cupredoxin-like copper-binding protein
MKKIQIAFLAVALVLTLIGCASGPTKLTVDLVEFMFTPAEFTVPAGGEVSLTLINSGAVEHELVIMKFGQEVSVPFDDNDEGNIYWEHEVEPGATETVAFTAPTEPGEYQVVCGIEGHYEGGMVGKLIVKP